MTGGSTPLARRAAIVAGTAMAIIALLGVLWYARAMVLLLFGGVLLAIFLRTAADGVRRVTRLGPSWSLVVVSAGLVALLAAGAWFRGAEIAEQLDQLQHRLPEAASALVARLERSEWGRLLMVPGSSGLTQLVPSGAELFAKATGILSSTLAAAAGVVVILFAGFYLAAEPAQYIDGVVQLFPLDRRGRARDVLMEIGTTLRWWLISKVIAMAAVGVVITAGLWALGVPLAFTLGPLAALLTFIPNIGPILSAVPPILLALASDPRQALWVALLFWGVHAVEGFFLTPLVEERAVKLPPVLTLTAQVLLAVLVGGIGVALAAPLTAAGMVLVRRVYVEDVLGDRPLIPGTRRAA